MLGIVLSFITFETTAPLPTTIFTTPSGIPAFLTASPTSIVANGVSEEGFITHVQPLAKIGPNLYPTFNNGKFQAKWHTTTPTGFLISIFIC